METQDLDIDNYDIYELLNIYQLPYFFSDDEFNKVREINNAILEKQTEIDSNIVIFYKKSYVLTDCIKKYRDSQKLRRGKYIANVVDDTQLIDKIKAIEDFETFDSLSLLIKVMNEPLEKYIEPLEKPNKPGPRPIFNSHPLNPPDKTNFTNTFSNKVVGGSINSIVMSYNTKIYI